MTRAVCLCVPEDTVEWSRKRYTGFPLRFLVWAIYEKSNCFVGTQSWISLLFSVGIEIHLYKECINRRFGFSPSISKTGKRLRVLLLFFFEDFSSVKDLHKRLWFATSYSFCNSSRIYTFYWTKSCFIKGPDIVSQYRDRKLLHLGHVLCCVMFYTMP